MHSPKRSRRLSASVETYETTRRRGRSDVVGADGRGQAPVQLVHQEFDELAKAGLSPFRILQITILKRAEFLGRAATIGSIAVGKNADLVLLDANPVESVQNLRYISTVVRAGFYPFSRAVEAATDHTQTRNLLALKPA